LRMVALREVCYEMGGGGGVRAWTGEWKRRRARRKNITG
jgi:hypothetical protein